MLGGHAVEDIGAIERADELPRAVQRQSLDDLAPGWRIGGGGQGDPRHLRPALVEQGELAILGSKIVAPLRHAVRFVDGEQGDPDAFQQGEETRCQQAFRSDVEQVQRVIEELPFHRCGGIGIEAGI